MHTHYDDLQIREDATLAVIKAAYKALANKWHPDKNPDQPKKAEQQFQIISKAFEVLSNDQSRAEYDAWLKQKRYEESGEAARARAEAAARAKAEAKARARAEAEAKAKAKAEAKARAAAEAKAKEDAKAAAEEWASLRNPYLARPADDDAPRRLAPGKLVKSIVVLAALSSGVLWATQHDGAAKIKSFISKTVPMDFKPVTILASRVLGHTSDEEKRGPDPVSEIRSQNPGWKSRHDHRSSCEIKTTMSDEDYRACGMTPPGR